ncbi:hypothetical protein [Flavobacterium hydrocarbonoxydans]|uniref:hypothetical protein n=1 Tax=Flavobacterium hydrocarbonoxydans TaxID=2683249 RepID=UPI0013662EF7|nr:hypothetical protein [Flavobacterium hydrocarbonoxydans]
MKIRLHIIIIILTLGFFMLPTSSYACGTKTEKSCCKKETTKKSEKKSEKKDCCKNKDSKDKHNSCGGKCGHSNCTPSTSVNFSIISFYEINFKNNSFDFSEEKSKFYHSKTFISSGFHSIWLIPKIA